MKKIKTSDLRPGLKFTKSIYIDPNNILVGPRVPIKQKDIERLLAWGINEVETAGEVLDLGNTDFKALGLKDNEVAKKEDELKKIVEKQNSIKGRETQKDNSLKYIEISTPQEIDEEEADNIKLERKHDEWVRRIGVIFTEVRDLKELNKNSCKSIIQQIIQYVQEDKISMIKLVQRKNEGDYLFTHSVNVSILAIILGLNLSYDNNELRNLGLGALLMDIGMVRIPTRIIYKKGKLSEDEFNKIQTHPLHGYRILAQDANFSNEIALCALEHQERCDGTGYPRKMKGDEISEYAKISAIVDAYEAMTKKRSYRQELISHKAMQNILSTGQQRFDHDILNVFLKLMGIYPIGSYIQLNNNCIGLVVEADPKLPMRPNIKILRDEAGEKVADETIIKLSNENDLFIIKAVDEKELIDIIK